ncbi:hypothetical protein FDP41_003408 [Naegleria fowleri]|uniref:Uncharacterized protein n=1 Tax=Naegleria fowleri TaxID=5763 RepID=A0A6A5BQR1_NAEFO|nr:uncharacterized protein FDP41_003408 [Naegleria fowleri]KAF0977416.1 hypothetical protein FDP41_003408 [Naegleria fowleri]
MSSLTNTIPSFCDLPVEIFYCQIFIHFDYSWVFRVFRLICKSCNRMATKNSFSYSFGNECTVYLENNTIRTRKFVECCEKGYFHSLKALRVCGGQELSQYSKDMDLVDDDNEMDDQHLDNVLMTRKDRYLNCFPNLQKLELTKRYFDDSIVKGIANSQNLKNLTHLNLCQSQVHDQSFQMIASPLFSNLTYLNLNDTKIGVKSVKIISSSPYFSKLKDLQLAGCRLGNALLFEISQSSHLKNLTSLNLNRNDLSFDGVKCIGQSSVFDHLTCLTLDGNNISQEGVQYLANCENLSNIEEFSIEFNANNFLTPMSSVLAIFKGHMKKIKSFRFLPDSYSELQEFLACKNITSLKSLNLYVCRVLNDEFEGLKLLVNCPNLSQLETLKIGYPNIRNFKPLITTEYMKNLTILDAAGNGMKSSDLIAISKTFPKLKELNISSQYEITIDSVIESLNHFQYLEKLFMEGVDLVSCEKVEQFASHHAVQRLVSFSFTHQRGFVNALFGSSSKLENLTYLNVRAVKSLELEDVQVLSTQKLAKLSCLYLPKSTLKDLKKPMIALLKNSPYLIRLNDGERDRLEGVLFY